MKPSDPLELADELQQAADSLGRLLLQRGSERIVFAESCTAGLVAASLASVPGISQCLCGSLVTYREASKSAWLGVDLQLIGEFTAVSPEVTAAMARGALERTAEADWSAAVTGHLGPAAPRESDGVIHVAIARRLPGSTRTKLAVEFSEQLTSDARVPRQQQAAQRVRRALEQALKNRGVAE